MERNAIKVDQSTSDFKTRAILTHEDEVNPNHNQIGVMMDAVDIKNLRKHWVVHSVFQKELQIEVWKSGEGLICKLTNLPLGLIVEAWRLDEVSTEKEYGVGKKKRGCL